MYRPGFLKCVPVLQGVQIFQMQVLMLNAQIEFGMLLEICAKAIP